MRVQSQERVLVPAQLALARVKGVLPLRRRAEREDDVVRCIVARPAEIGDLVRTGLRRERAGSARLDPANGAKVSTHQGRRTGLESRDWPCRPPRRCRT